MAYKSKDKKGKKKTPSKKITRVAAPKGTKQRTNRDIPTGKVGKTSQGKFTGLPGGGSEGRAPYPKMKKTKSAPRAKAKKGGGTKIKGRKMGRKTRK